MVAHADCGMWLEMHSSDGRELDLPLRSKTQSQQHGLRSIGLSNARLPLHCCWKWLLDRYEGMVLEAFAMSWKMIGNRQPEEVVGTFCYYTFNIRTGTVSVWEKMLTLTCGM